MRQTKRDRELREKKRDAGEERCEREREIEERGDLALTIFLPVSPSLGSQAQITAHSLQSGILNTLVKYESFNLCLLNVVDDPRHFAEVYFLPPGLDQPNVLPEPDSRSHAEYITPIR